MFVVSVEGYQIHGENPSQAQIFSIATTLETKAVCWQESSHRQFTGAAYTDSGLPLHGLPDGWGLMQRDPLQGENQLWNWQDALSAGVSYLNTLHSQAQVYLNYWHNVNQSNNSPLDDWLWNPRTQHPDRVWSDTFARYNTGGPLYTPNGNDGKRYCPSSPVRTACTYSDTVRGHINNPPW